MEKFVQPMLHGKDRCFRGMTRHKVEIRGKTTGVVAPQSHTCLKLPSLWKSHYRVFSGGGAAWSSRDFVRHYYRGNGRGVTVRETGHLTVIVDQYIAEVETRLKDQIASEARKKRNGSFTYPFGKPYNMTGVVFSIGDTVIGGEFSGSVLEQIGILTIEGSFDFYLRDEFADPADIGVEVVDPGETIFENIHRPLDNYLRGRTGLPPRGPQRLGIHTGEPYSISDDWSGTLSGQIYLNTTRSAYG